MVPPMSAEESLQQALATEPTEGEQQQAAASGGAEAVPAEKAEEPKTNGAWDEAWVDVPEPIKQQQRAVFEKWDRNVNKVQAEFAPYKDFAEAGVDGDTLKQAWALFQSLADDPRGMWDEIGKQWGFTRGETAQIAAAAAEAGIDADDLADPTLKEIRELRALITQQEERQQNFSAQQQQEQQAQATQAAIDAEFTTLQTKYGKMSDEELEEVAERAILNASKGINASIEKAYLEVQDYHDALAKRLNLTKAAPKVLGGGSGSAAAPQPRADGKPKTNDELLQEALAMAKSMAEAN